MTNAQRDVVIIGAGISGLAAAAWLHDKGLSCSILEAEAYPGGVMRSEKHEDYLIETGPNSLLDTSPCIAELIELSGLQDEVVQANSQAKKRYIVKNGDLQPLPMNPIAFLRTPLFSASAKLRLFKEPFVKPLPADEDESIADFVRRRLGDEFLDYAIDPFVAGVYAGDPEQLSVGAAFAKLKKIEAEHGSLIRGAIRGRRERKERTEKSKSSAHMLSFRKGLGQLPEALAEKLNQQITYHAAHLQITHAPEETDSNWHITFSHKGNQEKLQARHVIVTTPSMKLHGITSGTLQQACKSLQKISYAPIVIVSTGFKREDVNHSLDGFGYLVPKKEKRQILGTLWNTTIFPDRAPAGHVLLTNFIGGSRQPELVALKDEQLIQLTLNELSQLLGTRNDPSFVHLRKYEHAIPQYTLGHDQHQKTIDQIEQDFSGLHFAVNYRDGVSVSDCIVRAKRVVEEVTKN